LFRQQYSTNYLKWRNTFTHARAQARRRLLDWDDSHEPTKSVVDTELQVKSSFRLEYGRHRWTSLIVFETDLLGDRYYCYRGAQYFRVIFLSSCVESSRGFPSRRNLGDHSRYFWSFLAAIYLTSDVLWDIFLHGPTVVLISLPTIIVASSSLEKAISVSHLMFHPAPSCFWSIQTHRVRVVLQVERNWNTAVDSSLVHRMSKLIDIRRSLSRLIDTHTSHKGGDTPRNRRMATALLWVTLYATRAFPSAWCIFCVTSWRAMMFFIEAGYKGIIHRRC
jgi:hypothetical protein